MLDIVVGIDDTVSSRCALDRAECAGRRVFIPRQDCPVRLAEPVGVESSGAEGAIKLSDQRCRMVATARS